MVKGKCSLMWIILSVLAIGMSLIETTALAQCSDADSPQKVATGDMALKVLRENLAEASRVWAQRYREASSDEERTKLEGTSSYRQFEPRFLELARTYAGQPAAMEALQWLVECANPGHVFDEGLALVRQHHLEDKGIAKMCRTLVFRRTPGAEHFLLAVAMKHPSRNIQGLAYLSLARYLKNLHDFAVVLEEDQDWLMEVKPFFDDDVIAWFRAADPATLSARVDVLCERVISDYGDVGEDEHLNAIGERRSLADAARALSFSLHAVGSIAPETVGTGADGSRISLSDLRGKIVVLMFSANWCGPCKAMYGQLRELMTLYADEPFTVITIMADKEIATVRKAVDSGEISWPVIWDGDKGPIARTWHVTAYPTIYLIDRDGRIRHKGLRDDPLDEEVARMLGLDPKSRVKIDKRTRVWKLSLRDRNISGEELAELLEGYTELRELDLCYNPLLNESLVHLKPLKKLETLHLEHTGITDEGLQHLEKLPRLKQLFLDVRPGARTTKAGRLRLRRANPGLRLSFREPPRNRNSADRSD